MNGSHIPNSSITASGKFVALAALNVTTAGQRKNRYVRSADTKNKQTDLPACESRASLVMLNDCAGVVDHAQRLRGHRWSCSASHILLDRIEMNSQRCPRNRRCFMPSSSEPFFNLCRCGQGAEPLAQDQRPGQRPDVRHSRQWRRSLCRQSPGQRPRGLGYLPQSGGCPQAATRRWL